MLRGAAYEQRGQSNAGFRRLRADPRPAVRDPLMGPASPVVGLVPVCFYLLGPLLDHWALFDDAPLVFPAVRDADPGNDGGIAILRPRIPGNPPTGSARPM